MTGVGIVFDIGGTKTRVGKVVAGHLEKAETYRTPRSPKEGMEKLAEAAKTLLGSDPVSAIAGGAPGTVENGVLVRAHNLPKWAGTDIADELGRAFPGAPATLMNDTEMAALGEYHFGAGKGERDMLYVTVSTGVGGAHVVDGDIDKGRYNAEIGHQIVGRGELEDQISGTAVEKRYGKPSKEIDDPIILNELADTLAKGLYDNVLHWSPETIVLGGAMIVGQNAIPLDRVETTLTKMLKEYYPSAPRIKKAMLGDHGGLYGGVAYLERSV